MSSLGKSLCDEFFMTLSIRIYTRTDGGGSSGLKSYQIGTGRSACDGPTSVGRDDLISTIYILHGGLGDNII